MEACRDFFNTRPPISCGQKTITPVGDIAAMSMVRQFNLILLIIFFALVRVFSRAGAFCVFAYIGVIRRPHSFDFEITKKRMKGNRKMSDRKYFLEILLFIWHFRGVHREEIRNEKNFCDYLRNPVKRYVQIAVVVGERIFQKLVKTPFPKTFNK